MAFYVPASARRRKLIAASAVAAVLGLVLGIMIGRLMVPSVSERVQSVKADARQTSAGLRVISLHDSAPSVGSQNGGGVDIVLQRTRDELQAEFAKAPWLTGAQRDSVLGQLTDLVAIKDTAGTEFAAAAERLAAAIDTLFAR